MRLNRQIRPHAMPVVEDAQLPLKDAAAAIARGLDAWRPSQVSDAIRSAEYFIDQAKAALNRGQQ